MSTPHAHVRGAGMSAQRARSRCDYAPIGSSLDDSAICASQNCFICRTAKMSLYACVAGDTLPAARHVSSSRVSKSTFAWTRCIARRCSAARRCALCEGDGAFILDVGDDVADVGALPLLLLPLRRSAAAAAAATSSPFARGVGDGERERSAGTTTVATCDAAHVPHATRHGVPFRERISTNDRRTRFAAVHLQIIIYEGGRVKSLAGFVQNVTVHKINVPGAAPLKTSRGKVPKVLRFRALVHAVHCSALRAAEPLVATSALKDHVAMQMLGGGASQMVRGIRTKCNGSLVFLPPRPARSLRVAAAGALRGALRVGGGANAATADFAPSWYAAAAALCRRPTRFRRSVLL